MKQVKVRNMGNVGSDNRIRMKVGMMIKSIIGKKERGSKGRQSGSSGRRGRGGKDGLHWKRSSGKWVVERGGWGRMRGWRDRTNWGVFICLGTMVWSHFWHSAQPGDHLGLSMWCLGTQ